MSKAIQYYDTGGNKIPAVSATNAVFDANGANLDNILDNISRLFIKMSGRFDVVIIGAGSAGIAAAYALKDTNLKVCLIEKLSVIGGNSLNAWMNCFAASGDVPFLKTITEDLIADGKALYVTTRYQEFSASALASVVYDDTIVEQRFISNGRTEACVCYDPDALRNRYIKDLSGNIVVYTSAILTSVEKDEAEIKSVTISTNSGTLEISGKVFIDATADDVLLRLSGDNTTLIGSDASTRYSEDYGFTESSAGSSNNENELNYPDLIYRVEKGTENLSEITAAFGNDVLPYYNPDKKYVYFNPCAALCGSDCSGSNVISDGINTVFEKLKKRTVQNWKAIKMAGRVSQDVLNNYAVSDYKYSSCASILGVRETYRALCERMLNENNLYTQISSSNITSGENLDKKIAVGNHIVDTHGDTTIDTTTINANLKPYGVPYGCIIPKSFTNLFISSRGAGFTHIAASTFRLNKDVMQLGYAAGCAARIFIEDSLADTRNVDVEKLQSAEYTNFVGLVARVETYINQ